MNELSSNPLVSVCIPTFNRVEKLMYAVKKLQDGSYKNLQIIISDNNSADCTESACRQLAATDPRVLYYRHSKNKGPTHNFNFAKSLATGKYFLWHGDDDYLDEHYISRCVERLEVNPALVLVSGVSAYWFEQKQNYKYGNVIQLSSKTGMIRAMTYLWNVWDNSIFCGAYRRESVLELSLPNALGGDWAWLAGVILKGQAEILVNTYIYRSHGNTASTTVPRLLKALGLPQWQATISPIMVSHNCAAYIAPLITRIAAVRILICYPVILSLTLAKLVTEKILRIFRVPAVSVS